MSPAPDGAWWAAHTRYQHESAAALSLGEKGFEVFLPQYTTVRQWSDRRKSLSLPLFPCYVFLRGDLPRLSILTTPGVHGLVGFGGVPAAIPKLEIDAIRRALASRVPLQLYPFLKAGDWVRVKCGPLEGLEGRLVRSKGGFRLVLSVDILQKSAAVEVSACLVERAKEPERRESRFSFA
jgi:transcription antitermination factor NusG